MTKVLAFASLLLAMTLSGPVRSGEPAPITGENVSPGSVAGTAYYTVEPNGFRMVATLVPSEDATPILFVTTPHLGQRTTISAPRGVSEGAPAVEIARVGDPLHVTMSHRLSSLN